MAYPRTALGFKDSVNSLGGYSSYSTGDLAGASDDEVLDGYERVSTALLSFVLIVIRVENNVWLLQGKDSHTRN